MLGLVIAFVAGTIVGPGIWPPLLAKVKAKIAAFKDVEL